jgi:hypothetical protein
MGDRGRIIMKRVRRKICQRWRNNETESEEEGVSQRKTPVTEVYTRDIGLVFAVGKTYPIISGTRDTRPALT